MPDKKPTTEEGNIPEFWDNDIDSKEDEEWADKIWKQMERKYQKSMKNKKQFTKGRS